MRLKANSPKKKESDPIDWDDVKLMVQKYWIHNQPLFIATGDIPELKVLKGLSIDANEVQDIINKGAKEIFIMMAVRKKDLDKPKDDQYFTTVICGVDEEGKIMEEPMYDYCEPCPDKCPTFPPM